MPELFSLAFAPTTVVDDSSFRISATMPLTLSFNSTLLKYLSIFEGSAIAVFSSFLLNIAWSLSCPDISKGFLKATYTAISSSFIGSASYVFS